MGKYVCMGATLQCTFGTVMSKLMITDFVRPLVKGMPKATIMDFAPMVNIMSFGMCRSLTNPTVASATSAACGVLTPMPCIPVTATPWTPAGKELIKMIPALLDNAQCMCSWGGSISIKNAGEEAVKAD